MFHWDRNGENYMTRRDSVGGRRVCNEDNHVTNIGETTLIVQTPRRWRCVSVRFGRSAIPRQPSSKGGGRCIDEKINGVSMHKVEVGCARWYAMYLCKKTELGEVWIVG
jgi:hypothetical protein